jgi:hypothetical protein
VRSTIGEEVSGAGEASAALLGRPESRVSSGILRNTAPPGAEDITVTDREREPWQNNKPGPIISMRRERGSVTVWALGEDRFDVVAPDESHEIIGLDAARALAFVLAEQLGPPVDTG